VTDTGVGIPAEVLPRVFDLFTQIDGTVNRAQGGLGIGLAQVRQLVEMHGSTVDAASPGVGLGSTFTVALPTS
jgi:signal transduction histidine kinase